MKKEIILRILVSATLLLALAAGLTQAQGPAPQDQAGPQVMLGSTFTYQGQLKKDGNLVNDTCTMVFSLYDDVSAGTQVGGPLTQTVAIADGLFTVPLDFGSDNFTGDARWLEIAVQCTGDAGFNTLVPRQELTAAPYALSLRPGATISGTVGMGNALAVINSTTALYPAVGVYGESDSGFYGYGVYGYAPASSGWAVGVYGETRSPNGAGVVGQAPAQGIYGRASAESGETYGVYGQTDSMDGYGVYGAAVATDGTSYGVYGRTDSPTGYGVVGYASATTSANYGLYGWSASTAGTGVYGWASADSGLTRAVFAETDSSGGTAVYAWAGASNGNNVAVYGGTPSATGYAGYFNGNVVVYGNFSASGTKAFKIDHPLDPAGRYLYHFAQESPEVQNVYSGVATLDARGEALVVLPEYFAALNTSPFRYQLTPIGAPMPSLYIAEEIQGNQFKIAGGVPGKKVSWEVTAIRNDPYLRDHRASAEVDKPAHEEGTYIYPEGYGQPEELGLDYQQNQAWSQLP